jgi:hypothetical protein
MDNPRMVSDFKLGPGQPEVLSDLPVRSGDGSFYPASKPGDQDEEY